MLRRHENGKDNPQLQRLFEPKLPVLLNSLYRFVIHQKELGNN